MAPHDTNQSVVLLVLNPAGELLLGHQRNGGKWSTIAGHIKARERPERAGVRELLEETGLRPLSMEPLNFDIPGTHSFVVKVDGIPSNERDPDEEFDHFKWVAVSGGIPDDIDLAGPNNREDNVIIRQYGVKSSLEKGAMSRIAPFDPAPTPEHELLPIQGWQANEGPEAREAIAPMTGPARVRALHGLHSMTASRRNPDTGEREFLLHRGVSTDERKKMGENVNRPDFFVNHTENSSWTPDYRVAQTFARGYLGNTVSAWIPEKAVFSVPKQYGEVATKPGKSVFESRIKATGVNPYAGEHEVIVAPHHNSRLATAEELKPVIAPEETVHGRINLAAGPGGVGLRGRMAGRLAGQANKSEEGFQEVLAKAVGDDEIFKLLKHPDPVERKMALKLAGVRPEHLVVALQDTDDGVAEAAYLHPKVDKDVLMALMHAKASHVANIQKIALTHPLTDASHVEALAQNLKESPPAIDDYERKSFPYVLYRDPRLSHEYQRHFYDTEPSDTSKEFLFENPELSEDILRSEIDKGGSSQHLAVAHPHVPQDLLEGMLLGKNMSRQSMASKSPILSRELIDKALANHLQYSQSPIVIERLARHPNASPDVLDHLVNSTDSRVQAAVLDSPYVRPRHIRAIIENPNTYAGTKIRALESNLAPPEAVDAVLNNPKTPRDIMYSALESPGISEESLLHWAKSAPEPVVTHEGGLLLPNKVFGAVIGNPKFGAEHAHALLNNPHFDTDNTDIRIALAGRAKVIDPADYPKVIQRGRNIVSSFLSRPGTPHPFLQAIIDADEQGEMNNWNEIDRRWIVERTVKNPSIQPQQLEQLSTSPHTTVRESVAQHKLTPPHVLDKMLEDPNLTGSVANNPAVTASQLDRASDLGATWPVARNPNTSPDTLRKIYNKVKGVDEGQDAALSLAGNPNTPEDILHSMVIEGDKGPGHRALAEKVIDNPNTAIRTLTSLPKEFSDLSEDVHQKLAVHHPDTVHRESVSVRPGLGKLRKIRDLIKSKGKADLSPKELPPGDWSPGRLPNGNISAAKLQQHIDSQEPIKYNVSHSTWNGGQQHSDEDSDVFQLNITTDQVNRMKKAGVWNTFRNMHEASMQSGHPVTPTTIGWVRHTGNSKTGIFVDEIQSDFGQSFVKQASGQAREKALEEAKSRNLSPEETKDHVNQYMATVAAKAQSEYPEDHYQVISNILFKGKKPNEMIGEGFLQHLRDKGFHNTPVHIHSVESKAPISLSSTTKDVPAHFRHTYEQLPQKMGMEPTHYGDLPTEENDRMKGQPIYGGPVRKFEEELGEFLHKAIKEEDFKGISRAVEPQGHNVVDHTGQMKSHPPQHQQDVNHYRSQVLDSPFIRSKEKGKMAGITKKVVYKTPAATYMVKPYHEKIPRGLEGYQRHPIQGWAEMANQALFHAAGIGHLHQNVHVAEHNMGPGHEHEPALVIKMDKTAVPLADMTQEEFLNVPQHIKRDARKIAVMDFLSNNLDRHLNNLMVSSGGTEPNLLAIDAGRNFQYENNHQHKWQGRKFVRGLPGMEDSFGAYHKQSAATALSPYGKPPTVHEMDTAFLNEYKPIMEWWGMRSPHIREEMGKQLQHIKDQEVRAHVARNFNARADQLDDFARHGLDNFGHKWYAIPVPQYRMGEKE